MPLTVSDSPRWASPTTPSWPRAIRDGDLDDRLDAVRAAVRADVDDRLSVANPKYRRERSEYLLDGRALGGQRHGLTGGELATRGVDVGAAVAADGGVGAQLLEPIAELVDPLQRGAAGGVSRCRD